MKTKIGIVFGGKSGEHEVSVRSAAAIRENLDKSKYEVVDIFFDKQGNFDEEKIRLSDVIFPIIHGSFGEDGCLQGLLEIWDKPYVGAGVLGSAIGMDKDVQKRLLLQAGIPVAKYKVVFEGEKLPAVTFPVFVKPANMGSSVGIFKCNKADELGGAVKKAWLYDRKVVIEEMVVGRELEVAILGGKASVPGEVIPKGHDFYDYEAKYVDENGAELQIPAKGLSESKTKEIQRVAESVFKVLETEGLARVDMFLRPNGEIVINEINTLPGFTSISMYPKLWEASGITFPKLLDKLISLAIKRGEEKSNLRRSF